MKKVIIALAALTVTVASYGQGTVQFNNRVPPDLIARVTTPDGAGVANGFTAQLLGGPVGGQLTPLTPTTTFRTGNAAGFVVPVDVAVPGVPAGGTATFVMRAFNGATFETSTQFGESNPVTVSSLGGVPPGGGPPLTSPTLSGLNGFVVIPEPTTLALGALGAALLFLRRRK